MKKLAFLSWALLALLMVGCSEDSIGVQDESDSDDVSISLPLKIEVAGEADPISTDISFTFYVENAVSASYVIYDPEQFSYEDILDFGDFYTLRDSSKSLYGDSFSMPKITTPITISLKAIDEYGKRLNRFFYLTNGSTYSIVVRAKGANGKEQIATATTTLWGYPYLIIRPGWNSAVNWDSLEYNTELNKYMSFGYYNCQEYCWIVTEDTDKFYSATDIFELADNVQEANIMECTFCSAIPIEIPRTENTQRIWIAIRNGDYYLTDYYTIGAIGHTDDDDDIKQKNFYVLNPL